jgi:hypothetical protein
VLWEFANNYDQDPVEKYPLFTREEHEWLARHPRKRRPKTKDWSAAGPKVSPTSRLKRCILTVRNIEVQERAQ